MSRKHIKIGIFLIFTITIMVGIAAYASEYEKDPVKAGEWIGSSIKNILSNDSLDSRSLDDQKNKEELDNPDRLAGTILGEDITARELDLRAKLFELSGSKDPLEEAWDSLKVQVYEKQFAEEHGLTPSKQEIVDFTKVMREQVEAAPGGRDFSKSVIEAAGMTEDEYWDDYKVNNESPAHLTDIKIAEYLEKNNLPELDREKIVNNISDEITDQQIITKYQR